MTWKEHMNVDIAAFGKEYPSVHKWMDKRYYVHDKVLNSSWLDTHHEEAILKRYTLGTEEYNCAYTHILMDMIRWHNIAMVPKNKEEMQALLTKYHGSITEEV